MRPSWRRLWVRGRRLPFDPWKAALATVVTLAVIAVLGWTVLGSRLLVVRQIQVAGERLVARDDVVAAAGVGVGVPLLRVDVGAVRRRVEGIRQVESARVQREWPSSLRIRITERTPVAAVADGSGYALVDRFGVVVTAASDRPDGLPLVRADTRGRSAGFSHEPAALAALTVLGALPPALAERVDTVTAPTVHDVTLELRGGATVVWGGPERSREKARTLLVLLRRDSGGGDADSSADTLADTYDVSSPDVVTTR